jgi:hypothetical protein
MGLLVPRGLPITVIKALSLPQRSGLPTGNREAKAEPHRV